MVCRWCTYLKLLRCRFQSGKVNICSSKTTAAEVAKSGQTFRLRGMCCSCRCQWCVCIKCCIMSPSPLLTGCLPACLPRPPNPPPQPPGCLSLSVFLPPIRCSQCVATLCWTPCQHPSLCARHSAACRDVYARAADNGKHSTAQAPAVSSRRVTGSGHHLYSNANCFTCCDAVC